MANVKLIIDPNGLMARIVFLNSEQPPMPFETQKQLFSALPDLVALKKITQLEAVEIFKTAIFSKNFPVDTIEDDDHHAEFDGGHPFDMETMAIAIIFKKIFGDIEFDTSSEPIFKTCKCGKHGMIVFGVDENQKVILSGHILSKHEGLTCVTLHEEKFKISPKYVEKLRREILRSSLPSKI